LKLFNKKNIYVSCAILTLLTITLIVIPYPPRKPSNIILDDFTYAIEYTQYELNKLEKKHNLPSIAVSLLSGEEVIYQQTTGLSNIEENIPADFETVYKAGSISKLFTAIEIMRLYEESLIDLDEPITTYLPEFSIKSRFNETGVITIRNILAHRSGLPRNGNIAVWAWDNQTYILRDLVASLEESYVAYPADYRYKYTNIGPNILGRIIELKRGQWFATHMRDSLLLPIGMNSSGFLAQDIVDSEKIAIGYYKEKKSNVPYNQHDLIYLASGNLYTTLEDLNEFAKFIFNKGNVKGLQVLNESTLSMMFQPQFSKPTDPQQVGLGFFLDRTILANNELMVFHEGINQGTASIVALIPEKQLGVVMFSNSDEFESISKSLALEILELMYETKTGLNKETTKVELAEIHPSILKNYVGKYAVEGDISEVMLISNKFLIMQYQGFSFNLLPINESTFIAKHWLVNVGDIKVRFFEDFMIVSFENVYHSICPLYNQSNDLISFWSSFLGNYDVWLRHFSIYTGVEIPGSIEFQIVDDILRFSWNNFIVTPISQSELIILSGPFDGETMYRSSESGYIYWQNRVFKPAENYPS